MTKRFSISNLLLLFLFVWAFLKLSPIWANAFEPSMDDNDGYKKIVLIINQVRGDECCDKGSAKYLLQQINSFKNNNLSGNFAVRYDALTNPAFSNLLINLDPAEFELGAFLEITPKLAIDAGVKYQGSEADWYKAQNAYTVGYSIEDRKKIIDTYMNQFFTIFKTYPKFSTAWIMDTDTVNYMNQKYGVVAHQITREQWGTDSYTLSGGPVHYPYFASKNWLFTKNSQQLSPTSNDKNSIIVLRQTGSDPLFNYGDNTNSFTTQPNDYDIGGRNIDYFNKLKNQFLNQRHNKYGFLLLGLENSMAKQYQNEFEKQIDSIDIDAQNLSLTVSEFADFIKSHNQPVVGIEGDDFVGSSNSKSFWINALTYRIRILHKDNQLYISDLRLNNDQLKDPYNDYVAKDLAFWVSPFIFNASQLYSLQEPSSLTYRNDFKNKVLHELRKKYLPEFQKTNFKVRSSSNDLSSFFDGIKISNNVKKMLGFSRNDKDDLVLSYLDKSNNKNEITFYGNHMETNFKIKADDLVLKQSDFLSVRKNRNSFELIFFANQNGKTATDEYLSLISECNKNSCKLSFKQPTNNLFNKLRENYYPYFFPEIRDRLIDNSKSIFYAHNQYAIVGKDSVRFVFIPRDEKGFATNYVGEPKVSSNPSVRKILVHTKKANGTTFVDVISDEVGAYTVEFSVDNLTNKSKKVFFAPDCKLHKAYCMLHPIQLKWYLSSMFYTKLRDF